MSTEPSLIWDRPARRGRGPAPAFSRIQLAQAALRVADKDGLAAVTMRAVAAEIGSGPASLYRYVETRADLVALMVDEAYADYDLAPDDGADPFEAMVELAEQSRRILLGRPWLLEVLAAGTPTGPRVLAYLDYAVGLLRGVDTPAATRLEAVAIVSSTVRLLVENEVRAAATDDATARAEQAYLMRTAFDGEHPHLAQAFAEIGAAAQPEADEQLRRIVRGVLAGVLGAGRPHA